MTKKEKLIQNINEMLPDGVPPVDEVLTTKQLQKIYDDLVKIDAMPDPDPIPNGQPAPAADIPAPAPEPQQKILGMEDIRLRMKAINAKLASTDPELKAEGQKEMEALHERLKAQPKVNPKWIK